MNARQVVIRTYEDSDHASVVALWSVVFPNDTPWNEPVEVIRRKRKVQPDLFWVAQDGDRWVPLIDHYRDWWNQAFNLRQVTSDYTPRSTPTAREPRPREPGKRRGLGSPGQRKETDWWTSTRSVRPSSRAAKSGTQKHRRGCW